jgi:hypothetical protein
LFRYIYIYIYLYIIFYYYNFFHFKVYAIKRIELEKEWEKIDEREKNKVDKVDKGFILKKLILKFMLIILEKKMEDKLGRKLKTKEKDKIKKDAETETEQGILLQKERERLGGRFDLLCCVDEEGVGGDNVGIGKEYIIEREFELNTFLKRKRKKEVVKLKKAFNKDKKKSIMLKSKSIPPFLSSPQCNDVKELGNLKSPFLDQFSLLKFESENNEVDNNKFETCNNPKNFESLVVVDENVKSSNQNVDIQSSSPIQITSTNEFFSHSSSSPEFISDSIYQPNITYPTTLPLHSTSITTPVHSVTITPPLHSLPITPEDEISSFSLSSPSVVSVSITSSPDVISLSGTPFPNERRVPVNQLPSQSSSFLLNYKPKPIEFSENTSPSFLKKKVPVPVREHVRVPFLPTNSISPFSSLSGLNDVISSFSSLSYSNFPSLPSSSLFPPTLTLPEGFINFKSVNLFIYFFYYISDDSLV